MGGVSLEGDTLVIDRAPNVLDDLAIACSDILADCDVDHVFVSGYVTILAGRARSTEDIDVIIDPSSEERLDTVAEEFADAGFWGPAAPLDHLRDNLTHGANIWIAREDEQTPHLEATLPDDRYDRASLSGSIDARIAGTTIPIGPLELQLAYKLRLGSRTDLADAAHLHAMFGERLNTARLERWVDDLAVRDAYEDLTDG